MRAIVEIDLTSPMAQGYLQYTRTLPFATVKEGNVRTKSAWDEAVAERTVSVDEFIGALTERVKQRYRDARG